jgi:CTP:molybdopterin cytidylyltransferase MocA
VRLAAVLLAAGAGARYLGDHHKLVADLDGRRVVDRALDAVTDAGIVPPHHLIVVAGATDLALDDHPAVRDGARVIVAERWHEGQSRSLAAGIAAATELDHALDAVVVGLADQPGIAAEAWRRVALAPPAARIVVATYEGRRGPHPVRLARAVWPRLPSTGDTGGRSLLTAHPDEVVEVACPGSPDDIDTLEDRARWKSS